MGSKQFIFDITPVGADINSDNDKNWQAFPHQTPVIHKNGIHAENVQDSQQVLVIQKLQHTSL